MNRLSELTINEGNFYLLRKIQYYVFKMFKKLRYKQAREIWDSYKQFVIDQI